VRADIDALAQQVLAHIRAYDVRIVLRSGGGDDDAAIGAELAPQRVFRGEAAEDVAGADEEDVGHYRF